MKYWDNIINEEVEFYYYNLETIFRTVFYHDSSTELYWASKHRRGTA